MRAERRGRGVRNGRVGQPLLWEEFTRLSAAGHGCMDVTSRVRREVYARFCERQGVRLPLPTRRSFAWAARFRRLARDYERLPETLAGLHFVAFACLMLTRLFLVLGPLQVHNSL